MMNKSFIFLSLTILTLPLFAQGIGGYCLDYEYDGGGDWITIPTSSSLDDLDSHVTIECWVKPESFGSTGDLARAIWVFYYNENDRVHLKFASNLLKIYNNIDTINLGLITENFASVDTWYHVAVVVSSTTWTIYVHEENDTEPLTTATIDFGKNFSDIDNGFEFFIGRDFGGGTQRFDGLIDEIRIWDIERSETEIRADMQRTISGSTSGLVAYWRCDENTGQDVYDETNNNNDGVLGDSSGDTNNDPTWVSSDAPLPVELTDFSASFSKNQVILNWTTQSETDNLGFNFYRSENESGWEEEDFFQINSNLIEGQGTTSQPTNYCFIDENLAVEGHTYWYWLQSISTTNELEIYGPVFIEIPATEQLPTMTTLKANYPNPFNPETTILFSVKENEKAILSIYNLKGQRILKESFEAGKYQFHWNAKGLGSGIYFYKLSSPSINTTRKMLLMK
jgi:hypothetical protein